MSCHDLIGRSATVISLLALSIASFICLACDDGNNPVVQEPPTGIPQPLSGTITLENQDDHSGITVILALAGVDTLLFFTPVDGSYTFPTLADGAWRFILNYQYYLAVEDTIRIVEGRATRFTGDRTLRQGLQLQAMADRTTCTAGDTVRVSLITRNVSSETLGIGFTPPGSYYLVRHEERTIAFSEPHGVAAIHFWRSFNPGEADTVTGIRWFRDQQSGGWGGWIPGPLDPPGEYTIYTLWGFSYFYDSPAWRLNFGPNLPRYRAIPPDDVPLSVGLLRTVTPATVTLTAP